MLTSLVLALRATIEVQNLKRHNNTPVVLEPPKSHQDMVHTSKRERLKNMKVFVLDNSIRESSIGQPNQPTVDDKFQIRQIH